MQHAGILVLGGGSAENADLESYARMTPKARHASAMLTPRRSAVVSTVLRR